MSSPSANAQRPSHVRWNSSWFLTDTTAFCFGLAFFDSITVLPVLLQSLGASDIHIGFTRLIAILGFTIPSLLASHYIHGRLYHKGFLIWTCLVARLGLLTLPIVLLYSVHNPTFALYWVIGVWSVFWFVDGFAAISWFDIMAKAIPQRMRGRFFGAMQMLSGVAAMAAAWVLGKLETNGMMEHVQFAVLGGLWALGAALSLVALMMLREPKGVEHNGERPSLLEFLKRVVPLMKVNRNLSLLIVSRIFLEAGGIVAAFYILYAPESLAEAMVLAAQVLVVRNVGRILGGPLWAYLADRYSPVAGYRGVAVAVTIVPLLVLSAELQMPWLFFVAMFLMGTAEDGLWSMFTNSMYSFVGDEDRSLAIGVSYVLLTPIAVYGILGGFLLEMQVPFGWVVALSAVLCGVGLLYSWRLTQECVT